MTVWTCSIEYNEVLNEVKKLILYVVNFKQNFKGVLHVRRNIRNICWLINRMLQYNLRHNSTDFEVSYSGKMAFIDSSCPTQNHILTFLKSIQPTLYFQNVILLAENIPRRIKRPGYGHGLQLELLLRQKLARINLHIFRSHWWHVIKAIYL
jgi:hypothetical protein